MIECSGRLAFFELFLPFFYKGRWMGWAVPLYVYEMVRSGRMK